MTIAILLNRVRFARTVGEQDTQPRSDLPLLPARSPALPQHPLTARPGAASGCPPGARIRNPTPVRSPIRSRPALGRTLLCGVRCIEGADETEPLLRARAVSSQRSAFSPTASAGFR